MRAACSSPDHMDRQVAGGDHDVDSRRAGRSPRRPVSRWYLDTSAALKLLISEKESQVLAETVDAESPDLQACMLLETELRRVVHRLPNLTQADVTGLLDGVDLFDVPSSLFREAGLLPGAALRSVDALHLAAAVRLGSDAMVVYDSRLSQAAVAAGLPVIAPS